LGEGWVSWECVCLRGVVLWGVSWANVMFLKECGSLFSLLCSI
jgi:hypothetical protein